MNLIFKVTGFGFLCALLLSACQKEESGNLAYNDALKTLAEQDLQIQAYVKSHNLNVIKDVSGLYYNIEAVGDSAAFMSLSAVPVVTYTRKNLKDSLLDASFGATDFDGRQLKDHITGWQIGLRKIGKGGTIFMIIPSPLGFGDEPVGNIIPANTVLVCEVKLVDFH